MSCHRVLLVDDEASILSAFKRQLRNVSKYEVDTASGPEIALSKIVGAASAYAVIVADMQMPGMNGIQLLEQVRKNSPSTVRLMLTGNTDQQTAIDAVNTGQVFRFLTKPCSTESLANAIDAGMEQHRLITAEKDILNNTLGGLIRVLTDILSALDPAGFGHELQRKRLAKDIAVSMGVTNTWDIELAAMLSPIGALLIPPEISSRLWKGQHILPEEEEMIRKIPEMGYGMLAPIPRLERVAQIIRYQEKHFDGSGIPLDGVAGDKIPIGARIIKVARDFEALLAAGRKEEEAFGEMALDSASYDLNVISALAGLYDLPERKEDEVEEGFEIKVKDLMIGQRLLGDVETVRGLLLLSKGSIITSVAYERLINFHRFIGLKEPLRVDCRIVTATSGSD